MKRIISVIFISFYLYGCATYNVNSFLNEESSSEKLPNMKMDINIYRQVGQKRIKIIDETKIAYLRTGMSISDVDSLLDGDFSKLSRDIEMNSILTLGSYYGSGRVYNAGGKETFFIENGIYSESSNLFSGAFSNYAYIHANDGRLVAAWKMLIGFEGIRLLYQLGEGTWRFNKRIYEITLLNSVDPITKKNVFLYGSPNVVLKFIDGKLTYGAGYHFDPLLASNSWFTNRATDSKSFLEKTLNNLIEKNETIAGRTEINVTNLDNTAIGWPFTIYRNFRDIKFIRIACWWSICKC